jgi:hypothetical protein
MLPEKPHGRSRPRHGDAPPQDDKTLLLVNVKGGI